MRPKDWLPKRDKKKRLLKLRSNKKVKNKSQRFHKKLNLKKLKSKDRKDNTIATITEAIMIVMEESLITTTTANTIIVVNTKIEVAEGTTMKEENPKIMMIKKEKKTKTDNKART